MGCSNSTSSSCGSFFSNSTSYVCKIPPKGCCESFLRNKNTCNDTNNYNTCYENSTHYTTCSCNSSSNNSHTNNNSNYKPSYYNNCNSPSVKQPCIENKYNCNSNNNCMQGNCNSNCNSNCNCMQGNCNSNCNSNCNCMQGNCNSNCNSNCSKPQYNCPPINCSEILSNHINLITQALATYSEADNLLNNEAQNLMNSLIELINQILSLTCQGNNTIDKAKCLLNETDCAIPCCNNLLYNAIEKYDLQKNYLNSVLESLDKASKGLHNAICTEEQGNMYLSQYIDCVKSGNQTHGNYYNNCTNNSNNYCN